MRYHSPFVDAGLLLLRAGVGISFFFHGLPKLQGGPDLWRAIANSVGISFYPEVFGFLASVSEAAGGILFALGLLTRPVTVFLFLTMAGAVTSHVRRGDDFNTLSHSLELAFVFLGMMLIGPGGFSLDRLWSNRRRRRF